MFGYMVLISMVGISVHQNCISGLPFSVCCGCSVSKEIENDLVDDFSGKQVSSWFLWFPSVLQGIRIQNKVAVIVLRLAVIEMSC